MSRPVDPQGERLLTIAAAARAAGVHATTIRAWCDGGRVAFVRGRRGERRIPRPELDRCLARRSEERARTAAERPASARRHPSVRRLEARLRSIEALTHRLNTIQDARGIASAIVDEVSSLARFDSVRVYLVDETTRTCEPVAFRGRFMGVSDPTPEMLRIEMGRGLTGWVAEHNEPILTGDAAGDSRRLVVGEENGPESLLVVPVAYEARVRGVIVLSKNGADQFGPDDLTTMSIFARHAAQAIEIAENFERVRRQQAELEQQLASQRKLLEVNERLLSTFDPGAVLELIADSLKSVVDHDTLVIYRADHAAGVRRAILARYRFAEEVLGYEAPIYSGVTGWALEHGESLLANDVHRDPRAAHIPGTPEEPESMLVVPLQVDGEFVGALNVGRMGEAEAHFSQHEFELVKLFAAQASIALKNAEAHQAAEVRASRDSLTGLRNHGAFQRELEASLAHVDSPFALLMMDLDAFKAYNDLLGHPAGDRLLREVAARLTAVTREADRVYRYGGDEFAIILPGATRRTASEIADRIRQSTALLTARRGVQVGISVGIACFPDDGRTRDDLVASADALLYLAKPARQPASAAAHEAHVSDLHASVLGLLDQLAPSDLPAAIVTRATGLMRVAHGCLGVVEPDGSSIRCRAASGLFDGLEGTRWPVGEGIWGEAWASGRAITVDQAGALPARPDVPPGAGSVLAVPLSSRGRAIGVLAIASGSPGRVLGEREGVVLGRFADLAAVALDNASLYAAAQDELAARRRMEERLRSEVLYDRLTGLPNRELLKDRLQHALGRAERAGTPCALLLLDLDRFKLVNDSLGHTVGDQLLASVAARLSDCVRPGDTVARFGGDEFVVLLEAVGGFDDAVRVADRISDTLGEAFKLGGRDAYVSASIGIALAQPGSSDIDELLRDADIALYRAKADAATRHALYEPAMRGPARERLELENDLRRAIDHDELRLWYQPLVALESGQLVGHEALVRWQHPVRGLLLPMSFIPLAEETGLILPLGKWVLGEACREARRLRDAQAGPPPLAMNVNLSPREFAQPDLVARVATALEDNAIEPSALSLEITERIVMSDAESVILTLHQLRGLGVRLVLDDFGTGYSSLSYLRNLPIDEIKVDRSFVSAVAWDNATLSIVRAVVGLAHGLGMSVTAEGIETPEQLAILREVGCDRAQGNFFAHPMPREGLRVSIPADDLRAAS